MKRIQKNVTVLLSLFLILTTAIGGTLAYIVVKTPSLFNTFLSGVGFSGDLVIHKSVEHPFGENYSVPENVKFTFEVDLGESCGQMEFVTSDGKKAADQQGILTLTAGADGSVVVYDIPEGVELSVRELITQGSGFSVKDGNEPKTVTMTRNGHDLHYTNVYSPTAAPVNLTVTGLKNLEGRQWQEGDRFTFKLEYKLAGEGSVWQELGTVDIVYELIEVQDPAFPEDPEKTILVPKPDFDRFDFTQLVQSLTFDTHGTYSFRISEVEGSLGGVSYDKAVSYFDVLVGDADMDGSLEFQRITGYQNAQATEDEDGNYLVHVTVKNTYAPSGTASALISIQKIVDSLSGQAQSPAGYTFQLFNKIGEVVSTSEQTSAAGETQIELRYGPEDAGKTYHYTLKETNAGETIGPVTYDDKEYKISVSIVDDLDGTISAYVYDYVEPVVAPEPSLRDPQPTVPETQPVIIETEPVEMETQPEDSATEPTAIETQEPEPTDSSAVEAATVPTTTDIQSTEAATAPTVEETLSAEAATESAAETTAPAVVEPQSTQAVTEPVVVETQETAAVLQSQETETQPVELETQPQLESNAITSNIPEGANNCYEVVFVNVYDPADTSASFSGTKKLDGRSIKPEEFVFNLYQTDHSFTVAEGANPLQRVKNDEEGKFAFSDRYYSTIGQYYYVVTEDSFEKLGGVQYDESRFFITVTVTDDDGQLASSVMIRDSLGQSTQIVFQNTYAPKSVGLPIGGTKILNGLELRNQMFTFKLYQADQQYVTQGAALKAASNDENGKFSFGRITFDHTGEFYYVVTEEDSNAIDGVTYDDTVFGIKINVWDDGEGQLVASIDICVVGGEKVENIVFTNNYQAITQPTDPTVMPEETTAETETSQSSEPTAKPQETTAATQPSTEPIQTTESTSSATTAQPTLPESSGTQQPTDSNTPPTGDNSRVGISLAVMVISFGVLIILVSEKKRHLN